MPSKHLPDWDWRIWGSSLVTILWLGGGAAYLALGVGWAFWHEGADTIGGFFEGFFAPLAFLWLVVGLFIQQKELTRTREEMRQSNILSAQQASAIEASALTSRQQAFFLIADNVRRQTGNLLGVMLANSDSDLIDSDEELERHWIAHSAGDYERFPRLFLAGSALREGTFGRIRAAEGFFFDAPFRASISEEYVKSFRRLLMLARECDTGGAIRGTVSQTPHGLVYGAMLAQIDAAAALRVLDAPAPAGATADVGGTWLVEFDADAREHPDVADFILRLDAGDDGLHGGIASALGEGQLEAPALAGDKLFFRLDIRGPVLAVATVQGDRMHGTLENQYGDSFAFSGARRDAA